MARLLRHWLTISLSALVVIPVLMVTGFLLVALAPQFQTYIEAENRALSEAVSSQVDGFLITAAGGIERIGQDIAALPAADQDIRQRLDTLATTDLAIEALYLLDSEGLVTAVGLAPHRRPFRENFLGVDFSGHGYIQEARRSGQSTWSDTYLSTRGEISVAVAVPGNWGILVGELDLHQLSEFVRRIGKTEQLLGMLVDRKGHIVAHPDVRKALQQDTLNDNHLIQAGLAGRKASGEVAIDGADYVGTATPIPGLGWVALVVQPKSVALQTQRTIFYVLVAGTLLSLLVALSAALWLARAVSRRMHDFSAHLQAVANGNYYASIPAFRITELNELGDSMRRMAAAVLERESRLQFSQAQYRDVVEGTDDLITRVDTEGRLLFVNHASNQYFGLPPDECIGLPAFDFVHPDDRETTRQAFADWCAKNTPTLTWENRQISHRGAVYLMQWNITSIHDAAGALTGFTSIARDVTEKRQAEEKLHLAASVFTHAREGIMITAADSTIIDVNDAFSQITGYGADEARGNTPRILRSGRQEAAFYADLWNALIKKGHWYGEVWNRRKNGEIFAVMQTISAVRDAQGKIQQYVSLFSDITELKAHEKQLEYIAHYDSLTTLPNRVLLADRLHQAMAHARRRGQLLAVTYLDLDGFKAINDRYGHAAGDQLLMAVATRMKQSLREGDAIARLGGDEFVAVLTDLADVAACTPLLSRLLAAAAHPVHVGDLTLQVSASLGVTFYPQMDDVDADQLLRQADQAMYQAKLAGKNRYHIFDAEQDRNVRGHHENLDGIRRALTEHEFVLYYQPKVNMRSGTIVGAEALIRWQHPEKGLLAPAAFLPVIENHPLAVDIGEWVIDTALRQIELWQATGLNLPISVNVGARQLQQADFVERLRTLLAAHPQVKPSSLELEVLETSALEDVVGVSRVINDCRELGVMFALDDFGTGYSSLTYLKRLPVTLLKIDQSFVRDMLHDPDDLAILEGVLSLATAFRRQVIAEGVETIEHGDMLLQLGCELAQGYGIARPMPADQMPGWAAVWRPDPAWLEVRPVSGDELPLLLAGVEHRAWIAAIEEYLNGARATPPALDHQQCRFGTWLASEGFDRHGARPGMQRVESLHRQVHALGQSLHQLHAQGRKREALERLSELHDLRNTLLEQLQLLLRENGR